MGTAFSEESKEGHAGAPVPATPEATAAQVQEQTAPSETISPLTVATNTTLEVIDASHPRSHVASKQAFARVAAANEAEKGAVLSDELAAAEAKADINLAQFFDALESRCETGKLNACSLIRELIQRSQFIITVYSCVCFLMHCITR
jgi:hypothetical protein